MDFHVKFKTFLSDSSDYSAEPHHLKYSGRLRPTERTSPIHQLPASQTLKVKTKWLRNVDSIPSHMRAVLPFASLKLNLLAELRAWASSCKRPQEITPWLCLG